jgi:hypothetical protein
MAFSVIKGERHGRCSLKESPKSSSRLLPVITGADVDRWRLGVDNDHSTVIQPVK